MEDYIKRKEELEHKIGGYDMELKALQDKVDNILEQKYMLENELTVIKESILDLKYDRDPTNCDWWVKWLDEKQVPNLEISQSGFEKRKMVQFR